MTSTLKVELGERSYDIVIGGEILCNAGQWIAPLLRRPRVIIITDENVAKLHLETLKTALDAASITHRDIVLPPGEQSKSFASLEALLNQLLSFTPDRNITLIALGGGVIGDLTGFAASILLRGVDFIQIPTTLLAQVDSSVGGKTGINTRHGKNLVGSFYQPVLVLADTGILSTLPRRELLAGYAEVVKYGVINDYPFFKWLEEHGTAMLAGDQQARDYCVLQSCRAKALIVGQDEREAGMRALLNFGHTLGHALEAETEYSDLLLHGEAVSIGMMLALQLSERRGLCGKDDVQRVGKLLAASGLPIYPGQISQFSVVKLIDHCYHDKKAQDGGLTFILANKIGKTFISHDINRKELEAMLAETLRIG